MRRLRMLIFCTALLPGALFSGDAFAQRVDRHVPTPESVLGFRVGEDRKLADWTQITRYMQLLAKSTNRVRVDTLGKTTLDRPFIMLTISAPETLRKLGDFREIQAKLADPRRTASDAERARLIQQGKTVVLITCAIHSTEVGAGQVPLEIAYRLASSNDADVREILSNTIVLLIPSLNPDGSQLVVDWYRSTLGTAWEGADPPFLYHFYTGHDNNRDWYAFTQRETQLTVAGALNAWHPQIVHDIHQQGARGSRFFVPPYLDPIEPNVDPLLISGVNQLGTYIAWQMSQQGLKGVLYNSIYDAWTPARAYPHYHAGVRILSETASANMASPVTIRFESLQAGTNFDATRESWNFTDVWPGGTWRLSDIVSYQKAGAFALLTHAARNRAAWLRSFAEVSERATRGWNGWPRAWLIREVQKDAAGAAVPARTRLNELLRILTLGAVEVRRAEAAFSADGVSYAAGTYVILMQQPYASFAQTLLERQRYPDLRLYPDGPPRQPYDVTAHTLPLLFNVDAVGAATIPDSTDLRLSAPIAVPAVEHVVTGLTRATGSIPRIALYQSFAPAIDEGWTRYIMDQYSVPFATVHDSDVRAGALAQKFDVLVLASQSPREIEHGRRSGTVPAMYTGGLGPEGIKALGDFVRAGGTLVTLEAASRFAIDRLHLPVDDAPQTYRSSEFFIPGSILRLDVDTTQPLGAGMPAGSIAWFGAESLAFEPLNDSRDVRVIARYGLNPLLSGWALGQDRIAGKPALVEVKMGAGKVVLFGFRPQYRAQSLATYTLFFNALRRK